MRNLVAASLDALERHNRYWEFIQTPLHAAQMEAFLKGYGGTTAMMRRNQLDLGGVRDLFLHSEKRVWASAPTVVLDDEVHYLVTEMAESMPEAPVHRDSLPTPSGVIMRPNLEPLFTYKAPADVEEMERNGGDDDWLTVIAVGWSVDESISAAESRRDGGVDIWLYADYPRITSRLEADEELIEMYTPLLTVRFVTFDRVPWAFDAPWRSSEGKVERDDDQRFVRDEEGYLLADPHVSDMRRWMLSLWEFMSSELIVTDPAKLPRPTMRRLQRTGRMAEIPEDGALRIAHLRRARFIGERPQNEEPETDEEREAPFWSHRWYVRPHWRKLPSGRVVPVRGYIKGPESRPLVLKNDVLVVDR